jgi:hypothetical protein
VIYTGHTVLSEMIDVSGDDKEGPFIKPDGLLPGSQIPFI